MQEKQQISWEAMSQRLSSTTDGLGTPIDKGIFDTVVALNVLGFHTTASCEGHLERGIAAPWIDIDPVGAEELWEQVQVAQKKVPVDESGYKRFSDESRVLYKQIDEKQYTLFQSLAKLLDQFYRQRHEQNTYTVYDQILIPEMWGMVAGNIRLESIGATAQEILPDDIKKQKLKAYQQEMRDFTTFLKSLIQE